MFLKKVTTVKNVGRFKDAGISGGEYSKYTLIYGGNGRGKTTLCAVLRSLQVNDPRPIIQRKSFGAPAEPEVGLLLDTGPVKFSKGSWSASCPDIHIFDQHFISSNIHGGTQIDVDHRRNFYRIVVGPKGVALADEIDHLDTQVTAKQTSIAAEKKVLEQHVPKGMTFEIFLSLPADSDLDAKIMVAEKALKAVSDADEIKNRALLKAPKIPFMPTALLSLLEKSVDGIAADAAASVQAQVRRHDFHDQGEDWLSKGLTHVRDNACPFCGTSLSGNKLVEAYQGYFSEAYATHKIAIANLSSQIESEFGPAEAMKAAQGFKDAAADAVFWSQYCDLKYQTPPAADRIIVETRRLFDLAKKMVDAKAAAPLEPILSSAEYIEAMALWLATCSELDQAASLMAPCNVLIQAVKDANATADKVKIIAELEQLRAIKKRHEEPFLSLAKAYEQLIGDKKKLVSEKDGKKAALDAYDNEVLGAYERDINTILGTFDAGFRIAECGKNYVGKVPQSSFCLRFDTSDVDITKADSDDPSFETTMSAGDKNTFALAFFLAQLKRDADIGRKIVIFDDPFTSLDDFRREMTAKAIKRTGEKASQVLIFSHDKFFLDAVRSKLKSEPWTAIQISSTARASSIESWDIEREVKEGYLQDHMTLLEYTEGIAGEARAMRTMMRPLLEKYIRYRFPNKIPDGKWLGDMLKIIRDDPLHPLTAQYQELDDINEYTAPFHHDPNSPFSEDEVLTHAKRTAAIIGGC